MRTTLLTGITTRDIVFVLRNTHAYVVLPYTTIIAADESALVGRIVVAADAADLVSFVVFILGFGGSRCGLR